MFRVMKQLNQNIDAFVNAGLIILLKLPTQPPITRLEEPALTSPDDRTNISAHVQFAYDQLAQIET